MKTAVNEAKHHRFRSGDLVVYKSGASYLLGTSLIILELYPFCIVDNINLENEYRVLWLDLMIISVELESSLEQYV